MNTAMKFTPNIVLGTNDEVISPHVTLSFWKGKANILLTTNEHSINNYSAYKTLFLKG